VSRDPDAVNLSLDNSVTLAGITIDADGIGPAVRDALATERQRIFDLHGARAFDSPKLSAAIHEAGHVITQVALGGRVRRVSISECAPGAWIGYTENIKGEWNMSPESATGAKWLNIARNLYAGVAAEMLFDPDFRQGSSLDEVIMAQWATNQAALLLEEDGSDCWGARVHYFLADIFQQHQAAHSEIAARLMKAGVLKGLALSEMCRKIRRVAAAA
jgi:hypothetical protein